jgi:hypothetical protein
MEYKCAAIVYRGEWSTIRREPCGKPSKGTRRDWPMCGIHMRSRNPLVQVAPGRYRGLGDAP